MPFVRIKSAASYPNGIAIRSAIYPELSVKVFQDLKGNIRHAILYSNQTQLYSPYPFEESYFLTIKKILLAFHILIALLLLFFKQYGYTILALTYTIFLTEDISCIIADVFVLHFTKNGIKNARFHTAEHKMVNAYHKLKRVPTLLEIKKASRFTTICGSLTVIPEPVSFIVLYALLIVSNELFSNIFIKLLAMAISAIISFVLLGWGDFLFQYLEILWTKKPTDMELQIGIEALNCFLVLEGILSGEIPQEEIEKHFDNAELM